MKNVKINSLIELIYENDIDNYKKILEKYPTYQNFLQPGIMLGEIKMETKIIAELTILSLSTIKKSTHIIISKLQKKVNISRKIRLIGNLISTLSGIGLISAILIGIDYIITIAIINFIASISTLISTYIETSVYGKYKNINQYIQMLIDTNIAADKYISDLKILLTIDSNEENIIEIIKKSNTIAAELKSATIYI